MSNFFIMTKFGLTFGLAYMKQCMILNPFRVILISFVLGTGYGLPLTETNDYEVCCNTMPRIEWCFFIQIDVFSSKFPELINIFCMHSGTSLHGQYGFYPELNKHSLIKLFNRCLFYLFFGIFCNIFRK